MDGQGLWRVSICRRIPDDLEQEPDQYTWWSNRGRAWDNNVGWRLDYQVITRGLGEKVLRTDIYKDRAIF